MTEQECLAKMIAPGTKRPGKYREGVIQIWTTNVCDKSCYGCTQLGNLSQPRRFITVDQFRDACRSLRGYFGVVGMFGANCALHPDFVDLCAVMKEEVPSEQRGIWCNNPITLDNAKVMREVFNPRVSNLNVHMDQKAFDLFKHGWPECRPVGLLSDSRHSPPFVAMKDVVTKECPKCKGKGRYPFTSDFVGYGLGDPPPKLGTLTPEHSCLDCGGNEWNAGSGKVPDESRIWELISGCDINRHWSAMIGVFRGALRAWFCEIAGAQAMLHQDEPGYPDTGLDISRERSFTHRNWWQFPMKDFADQVRKHCFDCGVPLRGHGENAMTADEVGMEQVSAAHANTYKPKRKGRQVQVVTELVQLGSRLDNVCRYIQNSEK